MPIYLAQIIIHHHKVVIHYMYKKAVRGSVEGWLPLKGEQWFAHHVMHLRIKTIKLSSIPKGFSHATKLCSNTLHMIQSTLSYVFQRVGDAILIKFENFHFL